jgi:hypothetical protein
MRHYDFTMLPLPEVALSNDGLDGIPSPSMLDGSAAGR